MSTRCNILIKDNNFGTEQSVLFYRHIDGYPEGVAKTLGEFLYLVKNDHLRDNVSQAAGWLILLGAEEYKGHRENLATIRANKNGSNLLFKCGAYEPAVCIGGDIEYFYEVDLTAKTLEGWHHNGEKKGKSVTKELLAEVKKAGVKL